MKNKKNKELILRAILSVLLFIVLTLSIVLFVSLKKELVLEPSIKDNVPEIKDDFSKTVLNLYRYYDNFVRYDDSTNEIVLSSNDENVEYYTIGKYGKIYNTEIANEYQDNVEKNYEEVSNYRIYYEEENDKYYYRNMSSNEISDYYDQISFIMINNDIFKYLLLTNYNENGNETNYLMKLTDKQIVTINTSISNIYEIYSEETFKRKLDNSKYLIVFDKNDKFGLMDLNGNMILDYKYDSLYTYNNDDTFVANKDDKVGVINYKDEVIHEIIYDDLYENDNYTIATKNNKIGVFYKDNLIVDFSINYDKSENNQEYYSNSKNDILYLTVTPDADPGTAVVKKNTIYYLIDKKGIQKTLKGEMNALYINNDDEEKKEYDYFYKYEEKENNIDITFYDLDFYEYYSMSIPLDNNNEYYFYINRIDKTNYYEVLVDYADSNVKDSLYYVDLFNSKIVEEKDAILKYFDNGYGFTLNSRNELKIYKKDTLLSTYENIEQYLGGYYFLNNTFNKINNKYKSTIYELTFEKESNS